LVIKLVCEFRISCQVVIRSQSESQGYTLQHDTRGPSTEWQFCNFLLHRRFIVLRRVSTLTRRMLTARVHCICLRGAEMLNESSCWLCLAATLHFRTLTATLRCTSSSKSQPEIPQRKKLFWRFVFLSFAAFECHEIDRFYVLDLSLPIYSFIRNEYNNTQQERTNNTKERERERERESRSIA